MKKLQFQAFIFAILAAFFNAFVGIFSVFLFKADFSSFEVAFYKCLLAACILLFVLIFKGEFKALLKFMKEKLKILLLLAFLGFFMLYHFESAAYTDLSVASVVFMLFASSLLTAFSCESLAKKRFFTFKESFVIALALIGLWVIFLSEGGDFTNLSNIKGLINAIFAGIGYGLFLFFTKKLHFGSGFLALCALLFVGSFYLAFPLFLNTNFNLTFNFEVLFFFVALAFLPTIAGFYCTIKALTLTSSNSVQLIELSEPIFAMILAFIFLSQSPNLLQIFGGILILLAIFLHEF